MCPHSSDMGENMESLHSSVSLKELKEHRRQVSYPRETIFYGELSKHDIGKGQCPADLTQCSRKSQLNPRIA